MCINHRAGEILCHQVSRILSSQDFPHLELMEVLFFLDPQGADIDVTEFADPLAVRNGEGGR